MSTNGCIARKTETGFTGVYHHFDSDPSHLGKALFQLRNGHFKKNTEDMLKVLIDKHPAGWSTIVDRDFTKKPGFIEMGSKVKDDNRPLCYCHGDRHEDANEMNETCDRTMIEYVYVFDGDKMIINDKVMIHLDGPEPDSGTFGLCDIH
jgi:hypothetical protein